MPRPHSRPPTKAGSSVASPGCRRFRSRDDTTAIVTPRVALRSRSHGRCEGTVTSEQMYALIDISNQMLEDSAFDHAGALLRKAGLAVIHTSERDSGHQEWTDQAPPPAILGILGSPIVMVRGDRQEFAWPDRHARARRCRRFQIPPPRNRALTASI